MAARKEKETKPALAGFLFFFLFVLSGTPANVLVLSTFRADFPAAYSSRNIITDKNRIKFY
jgi:hypothetical protein